MITRALQYFFAAVLFFACGTISARELQVGDVCKWSLVDVNQRALGRGDGHVAIIVITDRENATRAALVGDRVQKQFMGDSKFHFVTLINFHGNIFAPLHGLTNALVRRRLESETTRIQELYSKNGFKRDAHQDLFAVADYDGSGAAQFGLAPEAAAFTVLVLQNDGRIAGRWNDIPPATDLNAALARARQ